MKIVYEKGQVLGKHGVRYLEEAEGVLRTHKKGTRYIERYALFLCANCGQNFIANIGNVKRNLSTSCGCKVRVHEGMSMLPSGERNPIHIVWSTMKRRCYSPSFRGYKDYGGRGITICEEWKSSYLTFLEWCLNNSWQHGLEIDRIDNNKGYSPDNCKFVTPFANSRNKRNNIWCWIDGEKMCMTDAAKKIGVGFTTIRNWSRKGVPHKYSTVVRFCK
jgi:hypothetical protein